MSSINHLGSKTSSIMDAVITQTAQPFSSKTAMETIGQRIVNLRKAKGYTQAELAQKIGKGQKLISDYERGRLRPNPELTVRLALALDVSTDELLGMKTIKKVESKPSKKILRRMQEIEKLPAGHQKTLLKTIDAFMKGVQK